MSGTCTPRSKGDPGGPACAPYVCDGSNRDCPATCSDEGDCATGNVCDPDSSTCVLLKSDGDACTADALCQSQNCYKGACCSTECVCGTCSTGQCVVSVAPGTDPQGECGAGVCDGVSGCSSKGAPVFVANGVPLDSVSDILAFAVAADSDGNAYVVGNYEGKTQVGKAPLPTATSEAAYVAKFSPEGNVLWIRPFLASSPDTTSRNAKDVVVSSDGNSIYVVGDFGSTITLGNDKLTAVGFRDGFIARLDAKTGNVLSSRAIASFDSSSSVEIENIALRKVGGGEQLFLGGTFSGTFAGTNKVASVGADDCFVARLGPDFVFQSQAAWGSNTGEQFEGLAVTSAGVVLAAGTFWNVTEGITFAGSSHKSAGSSDAFVAVLQGDATPMQQLDLRTYGSTGYDRAYDVTVSDKDEGFLVGTKVGKVDFFGAPSPPPEPGDTADAFIVAYNASGQEAWAKGYKTTSPDFLTAVTVDSEGFIVTGGAAGSVIDFGAGVVVQNAGGPFNAFAVSMLSDIGGKNEGLPLWGLAPENSTNINATLDVTTTPKERDAIVVGNYIGALSLAGVSLPDTQERTGMFVLRLRH